MTLPASRPSFTSTISALRTRSPRHPWVGPTPDEAEVADVLEEIQALHVGPDAETDDLDQYGPCTGCRDPWPCKAWHYGEQLALQWLGRAADRNYCHAKQAMTPRSAR
jgi:hypothetical protein